MARRILGLQPGPRSFRRAAQYHLGLRPSGTFRQAEQVVRLFAVGFLFRYSWPQNARSRPRRPCYRRSPRTYICLLDAGYGVIEREFPARVIAVEPTDVPDAS